MTLTIDAFLDDGELDDGIADEADLDDRVEVPVIIDTEAPKLYTDEIAYLYNPYTDGRRLEFYVSDNYDIAAVVPMTEAGVAYEYIPVDVKPGEKTLVSIDVSKYDATFRIAVCDYGCNESYYEISFAGANNVSFDSFYAYRRYSSPVIGGYLYTTDGLNVGTPLKMPVKCSSIPPSMTAAIRLWRLRNMWTATSSALMSTARFSP